MTARGGGIAEGGYPGSRKVGFMVIGVYDLRASNIGPPECQKKAYFSMVKVLGFTEQNRQLKSGSEDALWRHRISVQTAGLESSSN